MTYPPTLREPGLDGGPIRYSTKRNGQRSTVVRDNVRHDMIVHPYQMWITDTQTGVATVGNSLFFQRWNAQTFLASEVFYIKSVKVYIFNINGTPTDVIVRLYDTTGAPPGPDNVLASTNQYAWNDAVMAAVPGYVEFTFPTSYRIESGTSYAISVEHVALGAANARYEVGTNNGNPYIGGTRWETSLAGFPPAGNWGQVATDDLRIIIYSEDSGLQIHRTKDFGYSYDMPFYWNITDVDDYHGCCMVFDGEEYMSFYKDQSDNLYYNRSIGRLWNGTTWTLLATGIDHFSACTTRQDENEWLTHIVWNNAAHTRIDMNTYGRAGWGGAIGGATGETVASYNDNYGVPERWITAEARPGECYVAFEDYYANIGNDRLIQLAVVTVTYNVLDSPTIPSVGPGVIYSINVSNENVDTLLVTSGAGFANPSLVFDSSDRACIAYETHLGAGDLIRTRVRTGVGVFTAIVNLSASQRYNPASNMTTDDQWVVYCTNEPDNQYGLALQINMYKYTTVQGDFTSFTETTLGVANWIFRDPKTQSHPYGTTAYLNYILNEPNWETPFVKSRGNLIFYEDDLTSTPPLPFHDGIPPERQIIIVDGQILYDAISESIKDNMSVAKGATIAMMNHEGKHTNGFELHDTVEVWESGVDGVPGKQVFLGRITKIEYGEKCVLTCIDNLGVLDWEAIPTGGYFSGITLKQILNAIVANNHYGLTTRLYLPNVENTVLYDVDLIGERLLQAIIKVLGMLPPNPRVVVRADGDWIDFREIE